MLACRKVVYALVGSALLLVEGRRRVVPFMAHIRAGIQRAVVLLIVEVRRLVLGSIVVVGSVII